MLFKLTETDLVLFYISYAKLWHGKCRREPFGKISSEEIRSQNGLRCFSLQLCHSLVQKMWKS